MAMMSAQFVLLLLGADAAPRSIDRAEVLDAMKACQGYDVTATTNGARFQAEVLLRIARQARAERPSGPALLIGHADWFAAFLERTGLGAEKAPTFTLLAHQYEQDTKIDYRADRVVENTEATGPGFAANVTIWWPEKKDGPSRTPTRTCSRTLTSRSPTSARSPTGFPVKPFEKVTLA